MNRRKSISLAIVLLDLYYFLGWIYVFNNYPDPQSRFDAFQAKILLGINISAANLVFMGFAVISILLAGAFKNSFIRTIIMLINLAFLIFVLWQHI